MFTAMRSCTVLDVLADTWESFLGHVAVVDALLRMKSVLQTYRSRLRRFVFQRKDAALASVSRSAEIEAEALLDLYGSHAGFLVRYSAQELERRARVDARRSAQLWERVRLCIS
jgi:hypothetical protein